MSKHQPRTLLEWQEHIQSLNESELWEKAQVANRSHVVQIFLKEGYSGDDVEHIFQIFAQAFAKFEQTPPHGGYFDLPRMFSKIQT
jgi:hypothetical protein